MDEQAAASYLALRHGNGITANDFAKRLKRFRTIQATLEQGGQLTDAIEHPDSQCERSIERELEWASRPENHLLFFEEPDYPPLLREIDCPPPVLAVRGQKNLLNPQIAIVGSRNCSHYGKRTATWLGKELANLGLTVISGLALGIDTAAHEGALSAVFKADETESLTIAVVANGLDRIYPSRNHSLAERITEQGALVSEFPLGTPPLAAHFPQRNRIISGMCEGVVVVEAAIKSGSLITARQALEQNRELFAVPGQINSAYSEGCHWLISNGAKLLCKPGDVLAELSDQVLENLRRVKANEARGSVSAERLTDPQCRRLLQLIEGDTVLFDELLHRSRMSTETLTALLLQLQILGCVEIHAGRIHRID